MDISKELKVVTEAIDKDRELFYSYQSNIAMAVYDTFIKFRKSKARNKQYLSELEIAKLSNEAAFNFLNQLVK